MAIVNFAIPKALEQRVNKTIRERGFASKAEFFRMAAFSYMHSDSEETELEKLSALTEAVRQEVIKKFKGKKLPSLREQLADI